MMHNLYTICANPTQCTICTQSVHNPAQCTFSAHLGREGHEEGIHFPHIFHSFSLQCTFSARSLHVLDTFKTLQGNGIATSVPESIGIERDGLSVMAYNCGRSS